MVKKNIILYLFGFSTRQGIQLDNLLNIIKIQIEMGAQIKVVLIHDGVIGISKKGVMPDSLTLLLKLPITVYGMLPDILARGIKSKNINERIQPIEYEDLVVILAETTRIVSWM